MVEEDPASGVPGLSALASQGDSAVVLSHGTSDPRANNSTKHPTFIFLITSHYVQLLHFFKSNTSPTPSVACRPPDIHWGGGSAYYTLRCTASPCTGAICDVV